MHVTVLEFAEQDIEDGFAFYEFRQPGLGDYFFDSMSADLDSLMLYAGIHRRVHGFHRLLAHKFPFAIYYEVVKEEARVWAIIDCRRKPAWARQTLSERRTRR
ncbi:MAG: type II toxin-antitoxin system RelE/ParE family toxin [Opitutaceae bacterium]